MNCNEVRPLLGAYHDREDIDVVRCQEIDAHIATCPDCAKALRGLQVLSEAIQAKAPSFSAPEGLAQKVHEQTGLGPYQQAPGNGSRRQPRTLLLGWGLAAVAIVAAGLGLMFRDHSQSNERFAADLVADHVRSMQASHLFDVASSSQHTVKPWFQGKLNFSPKVPDLSGAGFTLLGGRLEYVNSLPAAALIYGKAKHVINVFVLPKRSGATQADEDRDGFHVVYWSDNDLGYWAVSDVNMTDLKDFREAFRSSAN